MQPSAPRWPTAVRLALGGDTMLGRGVGESLLARPDRAVFAPELVEIARDADAVALNLECCVSERGERWPDPGKPFFFRAPPSALERLVDLGVTCVNLANNHALDFGAEALDDTFTHLARAGIDWVGAGQDQARARETRVIEVAGLRVALIGLTDHPAEFAATPDAAGVAYAPLEEGLPRWLAAAVTHARGRADIVCVTPHWGPNMTTRPGPRTRRAGRALLAAGATLVAGHSAHVFHGVEPPILWDLGDLVDDYAVDPVLRNDLGLLWIVTVDPVRVRTIEAIPVQIKDRAVGLASGKERGWIAERLRRACWELGTEVEDVGESLVIAA